MCVRGLFRGKVSACKTGESPDIASALVAVKEELAKMREALDDLRRTVAKLAKAYDILNDTICDKLEGTVTLDEITDPD